MNNQQTENILITTIKWLAFLIIATPLIISSSTLFPYVFGKAIAFQILIELMIAVYAWLIFVDFKKTGKFNYLPKMNILGWAIIVFLFFLILSTLFSVDRSYSFWSKQERMDGLFNLAHFFALFFILSGAFKEKKHIYQVFDVSLGVSLIICFHSIGQLMGWYYLPYGERITATLGNAAFLATYLIFNIYFAFLLLLYRPKIWTKIWYGAMIALQVFILIASATRGAIYGFAISLFILAFFFIFFSKKNRYKKFAVGLLLAIIILTGALIAGRKSDFVRKNHILYRITDVSLTQGTGITRILSWKIGLNAFLDKPILGWGQENYYVAFNKHMNPVFFDYSGETFDRAHNKIVDLLVMDGILGLLAYLFVFMAAFLVIWPHRRRAFVTSLILITPLIAYFIQNFLLFDMPVSYLMFFLFLSSINIICVDNSNLEPIKKDFKNKKQAANSQAYPLWLPIFAWSASILVVILLWTGNLKPLFASQDSIKAQEILSAKKQNDETLTFALQKIKDSINTGSFTNTETRKVFPPIILSIINSPNYSKEKKTEALKFAIEELEKGIKEKPYFFDYGLSATDIYNTLASMENSYFLVDGAKAVQNVLTNYPNVSYFYYKYIVNRILAGDFPQAIAAGQKTIQLNPKMNDSNWYLGLAYFYAGDSANAKIYAEKAVTLGRSTENLNNLFLLGQIYAQAKEFDKSINYFQKALEVSPGEFQVQMELAKTYKDSGKIDLARELAKQLQASSTPQTASTVEEFVNSLK